MYKSGIVQDFTQIELKSLLNYLLKKNKTQFSLLSDSSQTEDVRRAPPRSAENDRSFLCEAIESSVGKLACVAPMLCRYGDIIFF